MVNVAHTTNDICRLDYLVGTLATAYKGVIKSLVVKDFCISDSGVVSTLKGTVLAMPVGDYEASLNKSGVELSRVRLEKGSFKFTVESRQVAEARDLQIDIIQSGRHVGTFLLKKETSGGMYISAVELSEELASFDLTLLTSSLREKVGLLEKAEDIVSQIHSTKKDWAAFSNKLSGFSIDFYWSAREGFARAFDVLAHFALLAAERVESGDRSKALSNYFDLFELPLANESDDFRLKPCAETWIHTLSRSTVDLSSQAKRSVSALQELHKKFVDIDIKAVLFILIGSLIKKTSLATPLTGRLLDALGKFVSKEDQDILSRFGESGQFRMTQALAEGEQLLEGGETEQALDMIAHLDLDVLDDEKAVSLFFDIAEKDLEARSANSFVEAMISYLSSKNQLSGQALQSLFMRVPRIMDRLIALDRSDVCADLLSRMASFGPQFTDRIMLDPRVARSVLGSGQEGLIAEYAEELKRIVIPSARVQGLSSDTWAEIVNPAHLERLVGFMDFLMMGDEKLESVLVHVVTNLATSAVLIPDDRLFQRRISAYLNSRAMEGRFLLNYLLLERLPVYFNEVGATSRLRDYSTEIDSWGNDPVIYFVRKQVHVNASSYNVHLLEHVLTSWVKNDPSILKDVVPHDIYKQVNLNLMKRYASIISPFFTATGVQDAAGPHLDKLLAIPDEEIDSELRKKDGDDHEAQEKVRLLCKLYKEVVKKYSLLKRDTVIGDVHGRLYNIFAELQERKSIVLSPEKTEPQESLYFKRHIAFGIPSVLGTYHEAKFDALKDMMARAEEVPVLLETIISHVEKRGHTTEYADLEKWLASLSTAWEILKVYGMENLLVDEYAVVMATSPLHPAQVIDVLKMWQKELAWMVSSITSTFHGPLKEIIAKLPHDDLPEHLVALDALAPDFADKAADIVMRDILSKIPGLVETDRLLTTLVKALRIPAVSARLSVRDAVAQRETDFYDIHDISLDEARMLAPDLGSKSKNLVYLRDQGLTIPAGVVLPARHTKNFDLFTKEQDFMVLLKQAVKKIEIRTGREFGSAVRPLFLSVRSGSYPSMPGILSSILYCGMNKETLEAFIRTTDNPALGWDSYRRFIEHYGADVLGLGSEFFEEIAKEHWSANPPGPEDAQDPPYLKSLVMRYTLRLESRGLEIPADVYEQLQQCVCAVYASWYSDRAKQFRSATGTSEEWGTSVTLMEMVSGNQAGGGAAVFFTRNPYTLEQTVFGETRERASGDDLASGKTTGRPLSRVQTVVGKKSIEETDPRLYSLIEKTARTIEKAFGGLPQEVEVTYTKDRNGQYILSVLQTRRMEQGGKYFEKFDEICRMESRVIGQGIGAGGGALSGVASFGTSADDIERVKKKTGLPVILLRQTANTADVSLMPIIKGIVTASGGVTSHAAVLAQKFGISAVVACSDMIVSSDERGRTYAMIETTRIEEGTPISLDGANGLVFSGLCFQKRAA